jgi:hypothetical protein
MPTINTPEELKDLIEGLAHKNAVPRPLHAAQIMELEQFKDRYLAAINNTHGFKVGDLVTPRKSSGLFHAGEPYMVVEVLKYPIRVSQVRSVWGDPSLDIPLNIRVAAIATDGTVQSWLNPSFVFDLYQGPDIAVPQGAKAN